MHPFIFERMPARIRDETRSMVDLEGESEEKVVVGTPPIHYKQYHHIALVRIESLIGREKAVQSESACSVTYRIDQLSASYHIQCGWVVVRVPASVMVLGCLPQSWFRGLEVK